MPTPKERLRGAEAKIKRAKHHVDELADVIDSFMATKPFALGRKENPQTGNFVYHVARIDPVWPEVSAVAGDIIQNLISTLDHIAYQMVLAGNKDIEPKRKLDIYFPVFESAEKYRADRDGRINGATTAAKQAVDMVEPYKGGKGEILWALKQLNNADKHRLLLTVAARFLPIAIPSSALSKAGVMPAFAKTLWLKPSNDVEPLKPGDIVLTDGSLNSALDKETKFGIGIALSEPQICKPQGLREFVENAVTFVEALLPGFEKSFV
jgi:hypothetical protein